MVSLCDAYTTYESWARVQGQEALLTAARQPAQPSVERAWLDWKKEVENLTQRTAQLFRENILESGWLDESVMLAETDLDSECRNAQITALRAIYIPDVIFLLYEVLYKTRDVVEGNLRESLELSQLVASDDGAIYKEMAKRSPKYPEGQLLRFLDLMRQSARQLMLTDQLRQQRQRIYSTDISSVRVKSS
ncbi:Nucleoporin nup84 [Spiromyces aspiralis]|uniref:Nucleoporin nup84 n=1 Tax=Spiromyces aspiralis TaxID=68401 RepID=A0ACC1HNQ9_9FUNG|nr:Nucleoporin nup84 [Spiromyces aspiralis]